MKKKPPGPQKSARTLENLVRVAQVILSRPGCSARTDSPELRINVKNNDDTAA